MREGVRELIDICHKVYEKRFVSAYDGNLSVRTSVNSILITRSGINKGQVREKDILEIDLHGNIISGSGKVSTENKIHLFAYSYRKDVNAVVHCHPVYTTAFAVSHCEFPSNILPEVVLTLGNIHICEYATPSTEQVPDSLKPYIKNGWAFILKNHGAVTLGVSIIDAYYKMEKLEHTAKILTAAKLLGGPVSITAEKIDELLSISENVYGIKITKDSL
jgi:L-fuculose-phosphate aldolase